MRFLENRPFLNLAPEPASGIGICRLVAQLDGEVVQHLDAHIGFSHRGIEKLIEEKSVLQSLVYVEKLNSSSPFSNVHCFLLALEKILEVTPPQRASYIRVLFLEISRILSHLRAVANLGADTGTESVYPIVKGVSGCILSLLQKACASVPFSSFFCIGGVRHNIPEKMLEEIFSWFETAFPPVLEEIHDLLTENRIFKSRTVGLGKITAEEALEMGFSGVNLRASGVKWDLRFSEPYEVYQEFNGEPLTKKEGDCYARYCLRMEEISHSLSIIRGVREKICAGEVSLEKFPPEHTLDTLTGQADHFEYYAKGIRLPKASLYVATETPLGEFGVYLVSKGGFSLHRCHFRSAGFPCLQALELLTKGKDLGDVRPILSSLNLIMTEVDR